MSINTVCPRFIAIGMPERSAIDPYISLIDLLRRASVKLEEMMQSASVNEVRPLGIGRTISEEDIPVLWFARVPTENEWIGIDMKKTYEESVRCMKDVIDAATNKEAMLRFRIAQMEGKLIPPHFTIALSYLKIRRLI